MRKSTSAPAWRVIAVMLCATIILASPGHDCFEALAGNFAERIPLGFQSYHPQAMPQDLADGMRSLQNLTAAGSTLSIESYPYVQRLVALADEQGAQSLELAAYLISQISKEQFLTEVKTASAGDGEARAKALKSLDSQFKTAVEATAPTTAEWERNQLQSLRSGAVNKTELAALRSKFAGLNKLYADTLESPDFQRFNDQIRLEQADAKVVLITGASSGIGYATAHAFAQKGYRVALAARDEKKLEELSRALSARGVHALTLRADVRDAAQAKEAVESTIQKWGRLDVLVNAAGIMEVGPFSEQKQGDIANVMQTNYLGTAYAIHAALPHMLGQKSGHIVNIASMAGILGTPYLAAYCASKFAVLGLTESLRRELYGSGVTLTAFSPGVVDTSMGKVITSGRLIPNIGTPKTPEQVAEKIVWASKNKVPEVIFGAIPGFMLKLSSFFPRFSDWIIQKIYGLKKHSATIIGASALLFTVAALAPGLAAASEPMLAGATAAPFPWRYIAIAGAFAAFSLLEYLRPYRQSLEGKTRHYARNISMTLTNTIFFFPFGVLLLNSYGGWLEASRIGLLNFLESLGWIGPGINIAVSVVLLDLAVYFFHRSLHNNWTLWRLHRVHHSDLDVDTTTGLRVHPGEFFLMQTYEMLVSLALGPSALGLVAHQTVLALSALFHHSNFTIPEPWASWLDKVLMTPRIHRIHHSNKPRQFDSNYSDTFSIWDKFFHTFTQPSLGDINIVYGAPSLTNPEKVSYGQLFLMGFPQKWQNALNIIFEKFR